MDIEILEQKDWLKTTLGYLLSINNLQVISEVIPEPLDLGVVCNEKATKPASNYIVNPYFGQLFHSQNPVKHSVSKLCMSRHIIRILNDMSQNPGCEFPGYFGVVCCIHNLSPDRYKTVIKLQLSIPRWNENDTGFKMIGTIKNSFYSPITGLMHAIKTYHIMDIIEVRTFRHGARDVQIRSIPN